MFDYFLVLGQSLLSQGIKRLLTGSGLGLVNYTAMTSILESMISDSQSQIASGDAFVLGIVGLTGIDVAISLVLSAVIFRVTVFSSSLSLYQLQK